MSQKLLDFFLGGGGSDYSSPMLQGQILTPGEVLCESFTESSINSLGQETDSDNFSDYDPW